MAQPRSCGAWHGNDLACLRFLPWTANRSTKAPISDGALLTSTSISQINRLPTLGPLQRGGTGQPGPSSLSLQSAVPPSTTFWFTFEPEPDKTPLSKAVLLARILNTKASLARCWFSCYFSPSYFSPHTAHVPYDVVECAQPILTMVTYFVGKSIHSTARNISLPSGKSCD